jgi:PAS domain S-box-containing protein
MPGADRLTWAGSPDEIAAILRHVVDATTDVVLVVDAARFGLRFANGAMERLFLRERGVRLAPGLTPADLFPGDPELARTWEQLFGRALAEGAFATDWITFVGRQTWELRFTALSGGDGGASGVAVVGRDVGRHRFTEDARRQSEARFHAIFDASPFAIGVSRDGEIVLVNRAFARLFGFPDPAAAVGTPIERCLAPSVRAEILARARARHAGREAPDAYDGIGLRLDGTEFPFHLDVTSFELPDGPAAMGFFRDLTDERRAAAERAAIEAQLRHAQQMEAIGTLAAGVAHDFANVLAPILSLSQLALADVAPETQAAEDLAVIHGAARRAEELVRHLLLLSRAEPALERTSLELGPLVRETVRLMRAALPATVEIRAEVERRPLVVEGDPTALHQVLLNLCTNARDALADAGGQLVVTLRTATADERPARARAAGTSPDRPGWVMLAVRDTGCGIPAEVQRRIFDPYFTTKPRGKGTGLGLTVTQGIVASLGGEIRVRSAPGRGSTFEILLPERGGSAEEGAPQPSVPRGQGERVLILDDEPAIRLVLVRALRSLGYQPTEAASPRQALSALRAAPRSFDALVVDQTMPGMSGLALAAECLALRPDLPVLLCTGDAEVDVAPGPGPRVRGVLRKPFTIEAVAAALRDVLAGDAP